MTTGFISSAGRRSLQRMLDRSLPNVTVVRYTLSSRNRDDEAVYSETGTPYQAQVKYVVGVARTPAGESIEYQTTVKLGSDAPRFSRDDKIVLPDGSEPPILLVEWYPPEEDPHLQTLYLGTTGQGVR